MSSGIANQTKTLFILLIASSLVACFDSSKKKEIQENPATAENHFRHLSYLIQLKNQVAAESWPGFSNVDFHQPVVYYTHERTYVLNPNAHIRRICDHARAEPFQKTEVITLAEQFTDTTNFQFANSYTESDSTKTSMAI